MFNRETKTIGNKLLSMKVPYDFQRGTGTNTDVCAMHKGAHLASVEVSLMPAVELVLDEKQDLVSKYIAKVEESQPFLDSVEVSPISALPIPTGFESEHAAAVTFTISNKDPSSTLVIKHQCFCLPYNDDFYLNVVGRCDTNYESEFVKAIDLAIQSRKLKQPLSVEGYYEIVKKEEAEALEFLRELENEQQDEVSVNDAGSNDFADLDADKEREDGQSVMVATCSQLLDELINDFAFKEVKTHFKNDLKFSAKFQAAGEVCGIDIELDEIGSAAPFIAEARSLLENFEALNKRSKEAIIEEMLNNYNQGWAEEGKQLTNDEFFDQLYSPYIHITDFDCSIFYETKDDLFHGHGLLVEYTLFKNFEKFQASMIG